MENREILSTFIRQFLEQAPTPWMEICGSHDTGMPGGPDKERVVDFDFKVDCSQTPRLVRVEFQTDRKPEGNAVEIDPSNPNTSTGNAIDIWSERIMQELASLGPQQYEKILWENVALDMAQADIVAQIRLASTRVAYGGRTGVSFHDFVSPVMSAGQSETSDTQSLHSDQISIKAFWDFDWPSLVEVVKHTPKTSPEELARFEKQKRWYNLLQHAMVDQKYGWVSLDDAQPPGSPFTRALKEKNLRYDGSQTQVGVNQYLGSYKFRKWGEDE